MKKNGGFFESFEKYGWSVVGRSPLPRYWRWVGVGVILSIIVISWSYSGQTVVGARDIGEVIEKAARLGDYEKARELLNHYTNEPLDHLEDIVYPERKVERRIAELEAKLEQYPGNRQIYLGLAELYGQLGNREKTDEYREKARVLDPSGE